MRIWLLIGLLLATTLAGCQGTPLDAVNLDGNILLWHSWHEDDARVLAQVLDRVPEIDPGTHVIVMHVPADELHDRYITATQQGVGPDLLIAPNEWIRTFVDAEVTRPIAPEEFGINAYMPATLTAMHYQDDFYGFPLAVSPAALYYNQKLVTETPKTLDELLAAANAGQSVAFVPRFQPAYWGIQPFGVGLFDATGRFTLATSGFTEWLTWLASVSTAPGVILNSDGVALRQMFVDGRVAYYVAGPEELGELETALGADAVGVAPLPAGPEGASGPLLPVQAIMLGTASSDEQTKAALRVAHFMTNPQQSTIFMRELGLIPANQDVFVDRRIYPNLAGFARQARTADVLPNELRHDPFYLLGDRAYANVLAGTMTPEAAVCEFGLDVVALQSYTDAQVDLPPDCPPSTNQE